jgi:hypothetical protein
MPPAARRLHGAREQKAPVECRICREAALRGEVILEPNGDRARSGQRLTQRVRTNRRLAVRAGNRQLAADRPESACERPSDPSPSSPRPVSVSKSTFSRVLLRQPLPSHSASGFFFLFDSFLSLREDRGGQYEKSCAANTFSPAAPVGEREDSASLEGGRNTRPLSENRII